MPGGGEQTRFVRLDIHSGERDEAGFRQVFHSQRCFHQFDDFVRIGAAFAAHAGDDCPAVINRAVAVDKPVGNRDLDGAVGGQRVAGCGEPGSLAGEGNRGPAEQRRHRGLCRLGIGEHIAGRWFIEADGKARVGRRGEGGAAAEPLRDLAGQPVGAVMPPQERHDLGAILGDRQYWRLTVLVGEVRREQADEDAGGADADDRGAGQEQARQQGLCVLALRPTGMDGAAEEGLEPFGGCRAGGGKGEDRRFH